MKLLIILSHSNDWNEIFIFFNILEKLIRKHWEWRFQGVLHGIMMLITLLDLRDLECSIVVVKTI